ncbi:MAG: hypothetical protein M3076_04310 [Actinomycetota bacterium]|nr:hypothetical protein [Actinomycetota bacterium]
MKHISRLRPSPAMAVALIALVISMGGTAVAASHLIGGDKLIKKGTLSGNRLRSHTLTGAQINLRQLGRVPSAADATHATTADTATAAGTAATAGTANTLPPLNWIRLTLINGWGDNFTPNDARTPAIAVDAQGIVHLRGTITSGGSDNTFAVAPPQLRPSQVVGLPAYLKFNHYGAIVINPDGTMMAIDPTGADLAFAYTGLDGVTYALG